MADMDRALCEASGQHGDSELLKYFCSDDQYGCVPKKAQYLWKMRKSCLKGLLLKDFRTCSQDVTNIKCLKPLQLTDHLKMTIQGHLTLYLIKETPFKSFANRADPYQAV